MSAFQFGALFATLLLLGFAGDQLLGSRAPEWNNSEWINSAPLKLSELKDKVVLVRFFMESSCPMCSASAPFLNRFHEEYSNQGLVVIGMYTPKPVPARTPIESVRKYVKDYGFQFPVALDNDWATLNKFWLNRVPDADFTSVSFLLDKKGNVRYIHPGGAYSQKDVKDIEAKIRKLLSE